MVTVTKYEAKTESSALVECVCDVETDVTTLPRLSGKWLAGSTAFVVETGAVYVRNSDNVWRAV